MDRDRIVKRLGASRQLEYATDIPFADISEAFQLIKEDTIGVFVPYGSEGKALIDRLKKGHLLDLEEFRVAQQYTVQIYRSALDEYKPIIRNTKREARG